MGGKRGWRRHENQCKVRALARGCILVVDAGMRWWKQHLIGAESSAAAAAASANHTRAIEHRPFTNSDSQHATEVEPGMFAAGSTIVTAFQAGRRFNGGGSDIGFATSTNGGASWTNGLLPSLTVAVGGTYLAASDPVGGLRPGARGLDVASLPDRIRHGCGGREPLRRCKNWGAPIIVSATNDSDKQWIICDNTSTSPFFGHCYLEWDDPSQPANGLIWMSTSTDGGLTWSAAVNTASLSTGLGGQPVAQPNGTVVVPIENADGTQMLAFTSTDGGVTWNAPVTISTITDHACGREHAHFCAALGYGGRCRPGVCRLAGLPLPHGLRVERHRSQHVVRREQLDGPGRHSHRRRHQHGGPLHSRARGRSRDQRRLRRGWR